MAKKRAPKENATRSSDAPFNNPFGALKTLRDALPESLAPTPEEPPRPGEVQKTSAGLESCGKLVVSEEKKGRAGKTVTRIRGLSPALGEDFTSAMKSALGCGATWERSDLVLLGALADRAKRYLERSGARRVVVSGGTVRPEPPRPTRLARDAHPEGKAPPAGGTGTRRAELRPGLTVDIVLKADQSTGELTRGEIEQILTKSPHHPHGIKVRLRGGLVGRVKAVLEDPQSKVR